MSQVYHYLIKTFSIFVKPALYLAVQKAIHSAQQAHLQELLRRVCKEAGLTQVELGQRLDEPQSLISDYERGERRLDLIELKQVCDGVEIDLVEFVRLFQAGIRRNPSEPE